MGVIKYTSDNGQERDKHDWHRPQGFTYLECRICGVLMRTPVENERARCEPDLHRKKPLVTKKLSEAKGTSGKNVR